MSIFDVSEFQFPYLYKFPGQASDERILFVVRENSVMLALRRAGMVVASLAILGVGIVLGEVTREFVGGYASLFSVAAAVLAGLAAVVGWWWVSILWRRSLAIVTTQRLTKFIYTTPFNRHNLSLPLDAVVDTGSYTKGFLQAFFKLGTFTARSSAASSGVATDDERGERVNKKYFYIENVAAAEDLQHYSNKLLQAFHHHREYLTTFRPFLPGLKGEPRKKFMEQYPEFWS